MLATTLLLAPFAFAETTFTPDVLTPERQEAGGSRGGGGRGGGSSGSGGGSTGGGSSTGGGKSDDKADDTGLGQGAKGKRKKFMGWSWQPYVAPGGGVQIDASGTSVVAGADVGILYAKKTISGNVYLGGSYLTGSGVSGYDVHLGDTTGYRGKLWGLEGGAEVFYNAQMYENGTDILPASGGVGVPVKVTVGPKKYYGYASVQPSWLFTEARRASTLPFGDELEWGVGAGLKLKWFQGEVGFAQRVTSAGTINTPILKIGLGQ